MTPRADQSVPVSDSAARASLAWAVKPSFWRYVLDAGGSITAVGSAEIVGAEVRFPTVAPPAAGGATNRRSFVGGVIFDAHHGALRAAVFDPALEESSTGTTLTARLGIHDVERVALADIDPRTLSATLRLEGAMLFDFRYAPGTELAPVRLV